MIRISPPIHYSIAGDIADALLRWMYDALIGGFESVIGDVVDIGTEVFEHPQNYPYVQVTIDFFQKLAWVFWHLDWFWRLWKQQLLTITGEVTLEMWR